ncbi:PREDICTED: lysine-rich nucleolar protein 1 [Elephantulus edwardii]|uniref:lysine-rich nucleolar protein 1 n=1 Tax=Elephantulus edwardii TaxID=28737 RepID=UPI0003F0815C|nr:PREDICTED: lysine-rich nucleolar protein 1 [Elephantulus edwardii]
MITKTQQADAGSGLSEKKKKKKKVVKEPESLCSGVKDDYLTKVSPQRGPSHCNNVVQAPEVPLVKKKKKKKKLLSEHHLEPKTVLSARRAERSPSSRKQIIDSTECPSGEKKMKRRSLSGPHGLEAETSLSPGQAKEGIGGVKKVKKHKKEKCTQDSVAFMVQNPRPVEAGDATFACAQRVSEELAALGQKRKQESPSEHQVKMKKKKMYQEGDVACSHLQASKSVGKGGEKNQAKVEVLEYIPVGDGSRTPMKKKSKSEKQTEPLGMEESALKKKKRKDSQILREPYEEEPDPDLEVVLEKKGNMDEACIDKVRRKALQEEIDRESGKTEAFETKEWTGTKFGQWDTAGFETEDQKLKFLKLMGGFKNHSPSVSRPPSVTSRPNMALSKEGANTLQQNLQQDYDRAMSRKFNRGAGLGFSRTPDKVFYIDRNASKSIKFED